MESGSIRTWTAMVLLCGFLFGCAIPGIRVSRVPPYNPGQQAQKKAKLDRDKASVLTKTGGTGWTERRVTKKELLALREEDRDLDLLTCYDILARLNAKSSSHISEDIRAGFPLKVPNDFGAYKDWTPLPKSIPGAGNIPKLILVVKDIPFVGWYEEGNLLKDSLVCIGREKEPTEAGTYKVLEKDADHYSRSYKNAFGEPAGMPWSLRIYGTVWIHGGDVTGGYCSPGCVYLPVEKAEELFHWAEPGTPVFIVETLRDLDVALKGSLAKR